MNRFARLLSISASCTSPDTLRMWMLSVRRKGDPLDSCFGFVDATVRPICRPSGHQRRAYNGHKRVHAIKFQSVSAPDGRIIDLTGLWEGGRHDCGKLRESGLVERLEVISDMVEGACIYGDSAYPIFPELIVPFKESICTEDELEFNRRMSKVSVSVKWCFDKVVSLFPVVDFNKHLK